MRALLSVSDKTGLVELASGLADRQVEIVSTGVPLAHSRRPDSTCKAYRRSPGFLK